MNRYWYEFLFLMLRNSAVDPQIYLLDPIYGYGSMRPVNYVSGRIRIVTEHFCVRWKIIVFFSSKMSLNFVRIWILEGI
jgi:hypothetical protein